MTFVRSSGILLHPTSLHGKYGIGNFGRPAYEFVDFLKKTGQKLWQILPLGHTGFGDSPYQCFSAFAGNPLLIDVEMFAEKGWLNKDDLALSQIVNERFVDYENAASVLYPLFETAFINFNNSEDLHSEAEFQAFCIENHDWLDDYAFFIALKNEFDLKPWYLWPDDVKFRKKTVLDNYYKLLEPYINFQKFLQFSFFIQWKRLKQYANLNGIKIIGDIPLYVSSDSVEAWKEPELFQFDKQKNPKAVAGVPPDYFSETGQLWGNPIYNWKKMKEDGFSWWIKRIEANLKLYDILRIDHFRGLAAYWSVPFGDETAQNGKWVNAPGKEMFESVRKALGKLPIIAEDLGVMTPDVEKLRDRNGFPGMKILQFAFDSGEENNYLPHTFEKNCVVYTGTHDNDTIVGWYSKANETDKKWFHDYSGLSGHEIAWDFIRMAWASVADIAIAPMQDVLSLGTDCRMNIPGTASGNWKWRLLPGELNEKTIDKLKYFTKLFGR